MKLKALTALVLGLCLAGLFGCGASPEVLDPDGRAYAIIHLTFEA
jgi:hypothetical protein